MSHRAHISKALASASVLGSDILEQIVRADCDRDAESRIERLADALGMAREVVADLERALAAERSPVRVVAAEILRKVERSVAL
jgi:hypothetical protein